MYTGCTLSTYSVQDIFLLFDRRDITCEPFSYNVFAQSCKVQRYFYAPKKKIKKATQYGKGKLTITIEKKEKEEKKGKQPYVERNFSKSVVVLNFIPGQRCLVKGEVWGEQKQQQLSDSCVKCYFLQIFRKEEKNTGNINKNEMFKMKFWREMKEKLM